jgi:DNA-binding Xre family transcriptional regulator
MIRFYKLLDLLARRDIKKGDLSTVAGLGTETINRLWRGKAVSTETINRVCAFLDVQPGDIMEYIPDEPEKNP